QTIRNYRDLLVWQKAMNLVESIYSLTKQFPSDERFGLVSQIRRAAISVPSNVAEGQARKSTREFVLFISHSAEEAAPIFSQIEEVRKMLMGLRSRLSDRRH
ncbi:MAG TPA: four helix bundle protein, partial [Candidatus Acidoferrales bacterium]|nr:four helix bundle protein [Candidatus Acidoferrales bacterium]